VNHWCQYCPCGDYYEREGGLRLPSLFGPPDVFDVYTALVDAYSHDPFLIDLGGEEIALTLAVRGYFDRPPRVVDVESSLELLRSVERLF
jgi:hypothetical protein